jgi:hypothetical protein
MDRDEITSGEASEMSVSAVDQLIATNGFWD